jgi:hypothetical protein
MRHDGYHTHKTNRAGSILRDGQYTSNALSPDITPDDFPWLITQNLFDMATACGPEEGAPVNGAIRIYRVGLDENDEYSTETITQLGAWLPDACTEASGSLMGGYAYFSGPDTLQLIVGYAPRGTAPAPVEADAGAIFLTFEFDAGGQDPSDDSLTLTSVTKAPAFVDQEPPAGGGYLSDAHWSHGIVAGAFSCNGIATFSLSGAFLQSYELSGTPRSSFLDCAFGSDGYIHCTTLDGEIWVFDPTDLSEPIAIVETRDQAAALYPTSSTGTGSPPPAAFFVADFKGGVHRIQYSSVP